ncbi:MAG: hypothetical protein R3C28_26470 [Pirellulaceae bacterium]
MRIPFHFHAYDVSTFEKQSADWCYVSELANDNFGWYAETPSVYDDLYDSDTRFVLVGDEIWGWS